MTFGGTNNFPSLNSASGWSEDLWDYNNPASAVAGNSAFAKLTSTPTSTAGNTTMDVWDYSAPVLNTTGTATPTSTATDTAQFVSQTLMPTEPDRWVDTETTGLSSTSESPGLSSTTEIDNLINSINDSLGLGTGTTTDTGSDTYSDSSGRTWYGVRGWQDKGYEGPGSTGGSWQAGKGWVSNEDPTKSWDLLSETVGETSKGWLTQDEIAAMQDDWRAKYESQNKGTYLPGKGWI